MTCQVVLVEYFSSLVNTTNMSTLCKLERKMMNVTNLCIRR